MEQKFNKGQKLIINLIDVQRSTEKYGSEGRLFHTTVTTFWVPLQDDNFGFQQHQ